MKGLAIYSFILVALVGVYTIANIADGVDPSGNVFAFAAWLPVGIFLFKYIADKKKKETN